MGFCIFLGGVPVLLEELVDTLEHALLECGQVCAAVAGVLAVDVREVGLAVAGCVCEGELHLASLVVDDRVQHLVADVLAQKVEKAVLAPYGLPVVLDGETGVQIGVVPQPLLDEVVVERVVGEYLGIGCERDERAVRLARLALLRPPLLDALLERGAGHLAVTVAGDGEARRKRVDGLGSDTVETDGELERLAVVLGSGVYDGDALDDLPKRDAASIVPDRDDVVQHRDGDAAAGTHDELVYAVVDDFLEQYVDAVIHMASVA